LPGAECTRQSLLCTRQSLCPVQHSAKSIRQKISRQRFLCRVLFIGHSAKTLPSANPAPGKEKWSLRRRLRHPLLCRVPCQRHPAKIFLIFFSNFLCRVPCREGTRQRFFYFFIISLPGVAPRGHPAKSFLFFFVISLPGARSWGTRQRIFFFEKTLPGALALALGKASKINFFYFVF